MKITGFVFSAAMMGVSVATYAQSQTIPEELLAADKERCVAGCLPGFDNDTCQHLCSCSVGEFKKRLDFPLYLDLTAQLSRNELTPQNQKLLENIAQYCADSLAKSGIEVKSKSEPQEPQEPQKP